MRIKLFSLITVVLLATSLFAKTSGEELFKPCKACHNLNEDRLVGPGLGGVLERHERAWLKSWITSSTKLIASGDADAKALFDEYKIPMADYDFSDEDMETLIDYIGGVKEEIAVEETTKSEEVVKETKDKSTEAVEEIKNEIVEEKDTESDMSKAFKNRPISKLLFAFSLFLLIGVLIAVIKINRTTK